MNLNSQNKNIGFFGGSFNPIHRGHILFAEAAMSINLQEIWFVPCYNPPHKLKDELLNFDDRVKMLNIATKYYLNFKTFNIEKILYEEKILNVTSTYNVLSEMKKKYRDFNFFILLGFDSICNIETWKNYQNLIEEYTFIISDRNTDNLLLNNTFDNILNKYNLNYIQVDNIKNNYSATKIRNEIKNGTFTNIDMALDDEVYKYIENKKLYR